MSEPKHIPTPYYAFEGEADEGWMVCSQDGPCSPDCPLESHCHVCITGPNLTEANAKFIARACNALADTKGTT